MRIFNQDKTQELLESDIDLKLGKLVEDKIVETHHDAVIGKSIDEQIAEYEATGYEVEEHSGLHYVTLEVFPNGGKSGRLIEEIEAKDAYDEYENIYVYVPYTAEEIQRHQELESVYGEIREIEQWFDDYDNQVKQHARCVRMGIEFDCAHGTIEELDTQAVEKAKRLKELRILLNA